MGEVDLMLRSVGCGHLSGLSTALIVAVHDDVR
jgi:hypothetical protein